MTELRPGSKLTRKTAALVQRRPLVLILHPGYLEIRRAGTRSAYALSYDSLYTHAARVAADRARAERKLKRTGRQEGRS